MCEDCGIKPIRSDEEHQKVIGEIYSLIGQLPRTDTEQDRLEVLMALCVTYEAQRWIINKPTPIEAVKFRMEQQGLRQRDLIDAFGGRSKVSEFLSGKRELTLSQIQRISQQLNIPADVLIGKE